MIIDCHSCGATYNVADDKIRGRRVRVRCKACGTGIIVDGREIRPEDATRQLSPEDATRQAAIAFEEQEQEEETQVIRASHLRVSDRKSAPPPRAAPAVEQTLPDSGDWTVSSGDGEQRVLSADAIAEAVNAGLVDEDAYVWREGMADWVPLMEVPEIRGAIESAETTRVASASELRSGARAPAPTPAPAPPPAPAALAPPPAPALVPTPARRAAVRPRIPLAEESSPESTTAYSPPAHPPRSTARLQTSPSRPDLFAASERVGSEDELLASSADASLGPTAPRIGARNETSVLFSLNALKATAPAPTPSSNPSQPSEPGGPTAADLLGLSASTSAPAFNASAALLSPPAEHAEPLPPAPPTSASYRARMDTTPPAYRRRFSPLLVIGAVALVASALFVGTLLMTDRKQDNPPEPAQTTERSVPEPTPVAPVAAAAEPSAAAEPEPEEPTAEPEETPEPAEAREARDETTPPPPPRPAPKPTPEAQSKPAPAAPKEAPEAKPKEAPEAKPEAEAEAPSTPKLSEALESAIGGSGKAVPKVVLEEEEEEDSAEPAGSEPALPPFNTAAAKSALSSAAAAAAGCKQPDGPSGSGKAQVTFATSGRATSANIVSGPFGGTSVGGCVARQFRGATVPPFSGSPVTVAKSFRIPD